jgi:penicillin-binding protein 1C
VTRWGERDAARTVHTARAASGGPSVRGALVALVCAAAANVAQALPSFAEVRAAHRPSDIVLTDRHGVPVQTLRVDRRVRRLAWVPLDQVSPALLQALVLSEDRRFYEHSGVDWSAVATSAWGNRWNQKTRGASTLTMQLAGLMDDGLARPAGGRSVAQKLGQALTAARLETRWKKSEILEAYLNSVAFRGEIVGIDALAATLFGKHASGLDAQEAAITAALLRGPNASPALVAQRACGVLQLQQQDCAGVTALAATALLRDGGMPLVEQLAPHYARLRVQPDGPPVQRSTLDARLQRVAVGALRRQLGELVDHDVEDGAVVVLDNASGEVLAWVGSSGSLSAAAEVDGVLARRQPGSALKPFVYALAFERRLITPASLIDDAPAQFATTSGLYLPQNYEHDFKGWVSARTALGSSLNVPAVRVGAMLGPDALFERLDAFGLRLAESGGFHGYALVLGSADVTLLDLSNAYRTLANGGMRSAVRIRRGIATAAPTRVADPSAVALVSDILSDNDARVRTFGLDSALATRGYAAVKTGTSKDLRDNWCIGFTDRYTVGVWVGNASGEPMQTVSGVAGAAPIWHAVVQHLHEGRVSRPPPLPSGVTRQAVSFGGQLEAARNEVFIKGTEQQRVVAASQTGGRQAFGISSPRDGSVYALDPDIPYGSQQLRFEGEDGAWSLDGKPLGTGPSLNWSPWPGPHVLVLKAKAEASALAPARADDVHIVRFEVRGASVKASR